MLARRGGVRLQEGTPSIQPQRQKLSHHKPSTRILMTRPSSFTIHEEAPIYHLTEKTRIDIQQKALEEHNTLYETLHQHQIHVTYVSPTSSTSLPMYIYRHVSVHHPEETKQSHPYGLIYALTPPEQRDNLYEDMLLYIQHQYDTFLYYDLRVDPSWGYIEGGSLIIDKSTKTIYAVMSPKAYFWKLLDIKRVLGYTLYPMNVIHPTSFFHHTNSIMAIGSTWVLFCSEMVHEIQRKKILEHLHTGKKHVIEINTYQAIHFCTHVIELRNQKGVLYTLMSSQAYTAFRQDQLAYFPNIVVIPFDTIETYGREGIRSCMVEI